MLKPFEKAMFWYTCFSKTFPLDVFSFVKSIYGMKQTHNCIKKDPISVRNVNVFIVLLRPRWEENKFNTAGIIHTPFNINKLVTLSIEGKIRKTSNDNPAVWQASTIWT